MEMKTDGKLMMAALGLALLHRGRRVRAITCGLVAASLCYTVEESVWLLAGSGNQFEEIERRYSNA